MFDRGPRSHGRFSLTGPALRRHRLRARDPDRRCVSMPRRTGPYFVHHSIRAKDCHRVHERDHVDCWRAPSSTSGGDRRIVGRALGREMQAQRTAVFTSPPLVQIVYERLQNRGANDESLEVARFWAGPLVLARWLAVAKEVQFCISRTSTRPKSHVRPSPS